MADLAYLVAAGLRHLDQRDGIPVMGRWLALYRILQAAADEHRASLSGNRPVPSSNDSESLAPEDLITTGEAATILHLTTRQVCNLAPGLGARRIGRSLVMSRAAVDAEAARRHMVEESHA